VMDENFDTRREIYGDAAVGEANLQMVNIARKHGSAVKFPGSGGAVIGLCLDKEKQVSGLGLGGGVGGGGRERGRGGERGR
jgi:glucuronokinase